MPFGPWEIFILLLIVVVIFGAGRLSQVGGAMGKSVREFRGAVREEPAPARAAATAPPTVTVTAPPVACPECQVANPATNRFCSACGATMSGAARPAAATVPGAAASPAQPGLEAAPGAPAPPLAEDAVLQHGVPDHAAKEHAEVDHVAAEHPDAEHSALEHGPLPVPNNTCPSCATVNPPGQPFCGQCGTRLKTAAA
jgi:sec-independent protein translocase protein TatA